MPLLFYFFFRGNTSTDKGSGEKRRSWYQPLIRSPSTDEYQSMDQVSTLTIVAHSLPPNESLFL